MDQKRRAYDVAGEQLDRMADRLTNARSEIDAASAFVEQTPVALRQFGDFVTRLSLSRAKQTNWLILAYVDANQSNQSLLRLKQNLGNPNFEFHPSSKDATENLFVVQSAGPWEKTLLGADLSTIPELSQEFIQRQLGNPGSLAGQAGTFVTTSDFFPPKRVWVYQRVADQLYGDAKGPPLYVVRGFNMDKLQADADLDAAQRFTFSVKVRDREQKAISFTQNAGDTRLDLQTRTVRAEPFIFNIGLSNPPNHEFPRFWILTLLIGLTGTALAFAVKTGQIAVSKADSLVGTLIATRSALDDTRDREAAFFENSGTANCEAEAATGRIVRVNRAMCDMFGYTAEEFIGKTSSDLTHPDDLAKSLSFLQGAKDNMNQPMQIEKRYLRADGTDFWALVQTKVFVGSYAEGARFLTTILDISDRKAMEVTKNNLVKELAHRVRNTVQLTASMARQTAKSVKNVNEYDLKFRQRLGALSAAQDVLFDAAWDGADLTYLAKRTLAPFESDRLHVELVKLHLPTQHAQTFAIALHELASNSMAFGALGVGGSVNFTGEILPATETEPRRLHLTWLETGVHSKPRSGRRGFGYMMLFSALPGQFGGHASDSRKENTYTYECWLQLP